MVPLAYQIDNEGDYKWIESGDTAKIEVPKNMSKEDLERNALENEAVKRFSDGKTVRKVIVVPGRLVNVVVG